MDGPMVEIAIPLYATPRRLQRSAVRDRLRRLIAGRAPGEPTGMYCCFGRMGANDAMVARGLAAAVLVAQGEPQR
jgi:hypothetical protein